MLRTSPASDIEHQIDVLWPVSLFRVELIDVAMARALDPFLRVVCGLLGHGVTDPSRMAVATGLGADFVRQLLADARGRGYVDENELTEQGRAALDGIDEGCHETGWMLRNDLTGEVLPIYLDEHPGYQSRPDLALNLEIERPFDTPPPEAFRRAFHESGRSGHNQSDRKGHLRVLGRAQWDSILVPFEARDVGGATGVDVEVISRHPFAPERVEPLFSTRLQHNPAGVVTLRELQSRARDLLEERRRQAHDAGLLERIEERMAPLSELAIPTPLASELRNALRQHERSLLGLEPAKNAAVSYGRCAEGILLTLCPPARVWSSGQHPLQRRLHDKVLLRDALEELLQCELPKDLESTCNKFARLIRQDKGLPSPGSRLAGVQLQLLPAAAALLVPQAPTSGQFRRALLAEPTFWQQLRDVLGTRNPNAHYDAARGSDNAAGHDALAPVRDSVFCALIAVFPPTLDPEPSGGMWDDVPF